MTNKTLSDEIVKPLYFFDNPDDELLEISDVKKHLQEFKEELKEFANPCMKCGSVQCSICFEDIDTQMQKHFGDKLI
jgi:sulfur transfer protein SufE